jgi:hypothetical protein
MLVELVGVATDVTVVYCITELGYLPITAPNELAPLYAISRTPSAEGTPVQDVGVDHRRAHIRVAEQFLTPYASYRERRNRSS